MRLLGGQWLKFGVTSQRGLLSAKPRIQRSFGSCRVQLNQLSTRKPANDPYLKNKLSKRENIYTLPNFLSLTRLASAPLVGYLIVNHQSLGALGVFTYSCVTDFVDGYIARKWNMQSVLGSVLDPAADKLLMTVCTVTLASANHIPLYMAFLILGRDVALGISALFIRYRTLPGEKTFRRFWDLGIPSAQVFPTTISKVNTALQMVYIAGCVIRPVLEGFCDATVFNDAMQLFEYVVAVTTVASGFSYLWSRQGFKKVGI